MSECDSDAEKPLSEDIEQFIEIYVEYAKAHEEGTEKAAEVVHNWLFDLFAARHIAGWELPETPDGLEEMAQLPIGFNESLDPDTIGRHFDKVVARFHSRSDTGSFYTPDEIVQFIDRQTIRPCIFDLAREVGVPIPSDDECDKMNARFSPGVLAELCTEDQAEQLVGEIANLSICDPACGSGQFLVQAVDEVAAYAEAVGKVAGLDTHSVGYVWLACHTVYGVDLVPETADMARLRIKLRALRALPVTAPHGDVEWFREAPNLDHQIKQGNALIGVSEMEQLKDALTADEPSGQTTIAGAEWA